MDAARGKKTFRTGAQDRRIAGLETQCAGIRRHRRAAFINDADDAERSRDSLDQQPIRPLELCQNAPHRIRKRGDVIEALGHGFDAGTIERQPVEKGAGSSVRLGGCHVTRIGGENVCCTRTHPVGGFVNRKVFLLRRSKRQRMRGGAGSAAECGHDGRGTGLDRFKISHPHPAPMRQSGRARGPYRPGG